jgi:oxygen-independent coproporphyrinogen-3 oxidase
MDLRCGASSKNIINMNMQNYQRTEFNPQILKKYDTFGPRYTSYSTAIQFNRNFTGQDY